MRKILLLTRYDRLGASSRVRFLQFLPSLEAQGFQFDVRPFFDDDYVRFLYSGSKISVVDIITFYIRRFRTLLRRRNYDLIWLEKEALPYLPGWLDVALLSGIPYVVDLDDAWFHRYDRHHSALVRTFLGKKADQIFRNAAFVVAGNNYLADRAHEACAGRIIVIPSTIDLSRYPATVPSANANTGGPVIVGWIGTPVTAPYLSKIAPAFRAVSMATHAKLRIIGAKAPAEFAGLPTESAAWSEATEISEILGLDVGIMPLADTPWERGKCAYKLLQVMAAGRPVVASPVGANRQVVQDGVNGFLADTSDQWIAALRTLISDAALRQRFGAAARQTVERRYSTERVLQSLVSVLNGAIESTVRPS